MTGSAVTCETTHRQVVDAKVVEHVFVVQLELGEVDVLFDGLVLCPQLLEAPYGVHGAVERGWREAMGGLLGSCHGRKRGWRRGRWCKRFGFSVRMILMVRPEKAR